MENSTRWKTCFHLHFFSLLFLQFQMRERSGLGLSAESLSVCSSYIEIQWGMTQGLPQRSLPTYPDEKGWYLSLPPQQIHTPCVLFRQEAEPQRHWDRGDRVWAHSPPKTLSRGQTWPKNTASSAGLSLPILAQQAGDIWATLAQPQPRTLQSYQG